MASAAGAGAQVTCFNDTKVQILTQLGARWLSCGRTYYFTCFTGTKVQILTQLGAQCFALIENARKNAVREEKERERISRKNAAREEKERERQKQREKEQENGAPG